MTRNGTPKLLTAVVTGAGSGIGRATTVRLAEDAYQILALDRDQEGLDQTVELSPADRVIPITVDLSDVEALEGAVSSLIERVGVPDLLVNNAGVGVAGTVAETSAEDWNRTVAVNLSAVFHMCRLL